MSEQTGSLAWPLLVPARRNAWEAAHSLSPDEAAHPLGAAEASTSKPPSTLWGFVTAPFKWALRSNEDPVAQQAQPTAGAWTAPRGQQQVNQQFGAGGGEPGGVRNANGGRAKPGVGPTVGMPAFPPQDLLHPQLIWEGSTWQACPLWCACLAPLFCLTWDWKITTARIDFVHGWCQGNESSIDLRRIVDIDHVRTPLQMCCNRGTIVIHSDHEMYPQLRLTTFGTREVFHELREAWTRARIATSVMMGGEAPQQMYMAG